MVSTPGRSDEISGIIGRRGRLPTAAFVDGGSVEGRERFYVFDPGSGTFVSSLPQCDTDTVDRIVRAARKALSGGWGRMRPAERARMIAEVARRIRAEGVIIRQLPCDALSYSPPMTLQPAHADRIAEAFAKVLREFAAHFPVSSRLP
jgi:aminomuconate-semialdehyde/2-hydroxymuconate-6-semialdehyde dehydrogenase